MNYLLDTCVISELVAKRPHQKVVEWIDSVEEARLHLSVITIGEVQKGIVKLPDSQRRTVLEEWLNDQLLVRFAGRIVPIDTGVMLRWGQLTGALEVAGKTMPAIDSLIAAIALHGNFSLVTRNEDDFKYASVPIVDPWS
jgi:tRNA(fMet)-specific endonuclease VapC